MTVSLRPKVNLSPFSSQGYQDVHKNTQIELRVKTSGIIVHSWDTSDNLNVFELPVGIDLDFSTIYQVRARREGELLGWSGWSEWLDFTTESDESIPGEIGPFTYGGRSYYVAPASTRVKKKWGLYGTDTSLPNVPYVNSTTPGADPNLGDHNTNVLTSSTYRNVNDGQGSIGAPAATHCRSLGDDWYLPNSQELHHVIYLNKAAIDAADTTTGTSLAAMGSTYLWSSTENDSGHAWIQRMSDGTIYYTYKHIEDWVVAIRRA